MFLCFITLIFWYVGGAVFFFKQKTAYEMRISDWSSDVCSSDVQLQLDLLVAQMTVEKALAKGFARRGGGILARQRVEQAVHRRVFSLVLDRGTATLLLEPDRFFDEIARDRKSTRLNSSH